MVPVHGPLSKLYISPTIPTIVTAAEVQDWYVIADTGGAAGMGGDMFKVMDEVGEVQPVVF